MATLNEIAYNIRNTAFGGTNNTEQNVSIRQIKFWVHYHRAQIIKELSMKGQSVPYEFYQRHEPVASDTTYADIVPFDVNDAGQVAGLFGDVLDFDTERQIPAMSARLATLYEGEFKNSDFVTDVIPAMDYYGREFYNRKGQEQEGDYGHIQLNIPNLINVNYGISSLQIRKSLNQQQMATRDIQVPVISYDEYINSKYNRFTNNSPKAYVRNSSILTIGRLLSVFSRQTKTENSNTIVEEVFNLRAVPYVVSLNVLLNNPTEASTWNNDDDFYPMSQYYISDLSNRILSKEFNMALTVPSDLISDNADTTKIIQPQTQRQVRQR